jgi:hypothetical protein
MSKVDELYASCKNVLPGHGPRQMMRVVFQEQDAGFIRPSEVRINEKSHFS